MKIHYITVILVCAILSAAPFAMADTVVLDASKDNTLFEDATGSLGNGSGEFLFSGRTLQGAGIDIRRTLIAFDIAGAIPAGATIDSVTLTLFVSQTITGAVDFSLHKVTSDWNEGASNAPGMEGGGTAAAVGDATWLHTSFNTAFWTTAGGDFNAAASATQSVTGPFASFTWGSTPGMVADVQAWLDTPADNFGWLIKDDESTVPTAKRFDSRTNLTVANRPKLTVDYTLPTTTVPAMSQWGLIAMALVMLAAGVALVRRHALGERDQSGNRRT